MLPFLIGKLICLFIRHKKEEFWVPGLGEFFWEGFSHHLVLVYCKRCGKNLGMSFKLDIGFPEHPNCRCVTYNNVQF